MDYPKIILHKGKEFSFQRKHPWVFSGAIAKKDSNLNDGDLVEVYANNKEFLATGFFSNGSIAVRIISFSKTEINEAFWFHKIREAFEYRMHLNLLSENNNVFRLFFGEGDGVPGLIIDYYNGHCVLQVHTYGVYLHKQKIVEALIFILGKKLKSVYDKSAETLGKHFSSDAVNSFLHGNLEDELIVNENNLSFKIDFINGQKTGFFIDQRENRKLLGSMSKDKTVLNTFSYTGGFSIYAGANSAKEVHSVDVSEKAIELCKRNIELNKQQNQKVFVEDTFDFLKDKKDVYDLIILDPPAFAKSRDSKHNAVIGYKRLNALAFKQIKKNGIVFTFSCSGVVDKFLFYNTITAAAIESNRDIKILQYLNQPADHPTTPYFPEGEYLKGMVLFVG